METNKGSSSQKVTESRPVGTAGQEQPAIIASRGPTTSNPAIHKIMMVAGEASGDKHAAELVRSIKRLLPDHNFELFGSGGQEMREAGVETMIDARDVAIMGIPEIARALGKLYRAFRSLVRAARKRGPEVVILVDWPEFNLKLAKRLHRLGFKIIYYISPQVWAWRSYRVKGIRRYVDKMLVILPFEEEYYKNHGVNAEYVGHPLIDQVATTLTCNDFNNKYGLDPDRTTIALMPGSRSKEIHYHLPVMLRAARIIVDRYIYSSGNNENKPPQFVLPLASTVRREDVSRVVGIHCQSGQIDIAIIENDTSNAAGNATLAVVASGTATVECALLGTPMIIVYRASEFNWRLIRPLINVDMVGMVNLIADKQIAPELIQNDMTPEKIAAAVIRLLEHPEELQQMKEELSIVRNKLAGKGEPASDCAARAVLELIHK